METIAAPSGSAEALRRLASTPDEAAWAWIAEHEGPAMYQVAARLLGANAAEDACQEALLHVRSGARHFTPPPGSDADAAARAWLLRITANAAAMWARGERRRTARERQVPAAREAASPTAAIDSLRQALAELPEDQRLPVVLHHLGGQDFATVAAALGTSPGAARVRAHRGIARLRERLSRAGVLVAAAALLERLGASEAAMPSALAARWTTLLASPSTPAVATTAIFGGLSIMSKFAIACAGLAVASLLSLTIQPSQAEEHADKPAEETKPAAEPVKADVKKEGLDAMAEGTKGTSTGTILSKEKNKLILRTGDGDLLFMPHWRGGNPKDGGGLDKEMVARLEKFKTGDKVRIEWTWSERRRIESIQEAN